MERQEIMSCISNLARAQGGYMRLYQAIQEDESILDYLEQQQFKSQVELVLFMEA